MEFSFFTDLEENLSSMVQQRKQKEKLRWFALVLMCIMPLGNLFCDPRPIQQEIQMYLGLSDTEYNLFSSLYSFPNIGLSLVVGYYCDYFGRRLVILCSQSCVLIGQLLFCFGGTFKSYWLMLVGRSVFGVGQETLFVGLSAILSKWFSEKELAQAFGWIFFATRLGLGLNSLFLPNLITEQYNIVYAVYVGLCSSVVAWVIGICLVVLDRWYENRQGMLWVMRSFYKEEEIEETYNISILKTFSISFWLLIGIAFLIYSPFYSLSYNVVKYMGIKYNFNSDDAGDIYAYTLFFAGVFVPVIGYLLDQKGKRIKIMIAGTVLFIASLLIFISQKNPRELSSDYLDESNYNVLIPLCIYTIFQSLFDPGLWPSINLLVGQYTRGLAFGILNSAIALGTVIFPILSGIISDRHGQNDIQGINNVMKCYLVTVTLGLIGLLALHKIDTLNGRKLDKNEKEF